MVNSVKIDFKGKTVKDVIDEIGYNRPFSIVMEGDFTYPLQMKFTKDKDYTYLSNCPLGRRDHMSSRINLEDPFDDCIEVYQVGAYDPKFLKLVNKYGLSV